MSENKRPDTQGWDTEAVRRRIISEVDAGAETGSKKKKHRKFNWKIYIAAVVLGSMLLAGLGWILANDLCALDKGNDTYTVTIEEGDGVFKIASKLKKAGLIELKGFFVLYEIFTGAKKDIDPGTYELNTSMDYRSLVNNMYDPDARRRAQEGLVLLTIPEGYTVQQIVDLLAENKISTKEELIDAVSNFDFGEEYPFIDSSLNGQINRLEGYLFPDTYEFSTEKSAVYAIDTMLTNFNNRVSGDLLAEIQNSDYSLKEIVTLCCLHLLCRHHCAGSYIHSPLKLLAQPADLADRAADGIGTALVECDLQKSDPSGVERLCGGVDLVIIYISKNGNDLVAQDAVQYLFLHRTYSFHIMKLYFVL